MFVAGMVVVDYLLFVSSDTSLVKSDVFRCRVLHMGHRVVVSHAHAGSTCTKKMDAPGRETQNELQRRRRRVTMREENGGGRKMEPVGVGGVGVVGWVASVYVMRHASEFEKAKVLFSRPAKVCENVMDGATGLVGDVGIDLVGWVVVVCVVVV